jgi:hypothetical protein
VATPKAFARGGSCNLPCCGCACWDWVCRADARRYCRRPC